MLSVQNIAWPIGVSEVKVAHLCNSLWPHGLHRQWNSPGQNTRLGNLSLLQRIFLTHSKYIVNTYYY